MSTGAEGRGLRRLRRPGAPKRAAREAELEEARALQNRLLPSAAPQLRGFRIACAWRPSEEMSGDYFDVFPLGADRMGLCIADVSGKGAAAAALMSELQTAVRTFAPEEASPAALCTRVNQALCHPGPQTRYATMFYGILGADRVLRYESAGHCAPLLVRGDGGIEFPVSLSGVIGIFSHWLYQDQQVELRSGDCLLLVTDGILLAENRRHGEFGYQRLVAAVESGRGEDPAALAEKILAEVGEFSGSKLRDDASLIVVDCA